MVPAGGRVDGPSRLQPVTCDSSLFVSLAAVLVSQRSPNDRQGPYSCQPFHHRLEGGRQRSGGMGDGSPPPASPAVCADGSVHLLQCVRGCRIAPTGDPLASWRAEDGSANNPPPRTTSSPGDHVHTEDVSYEADGLQLVGYLALPDRTDPGPAVLVAHEGPRLDDHAKNLRPPLRRAGLRSLRARLQRRGASPLPRSPR